MHIAKLGNLFIKSQKFHDYCDPVSNKKAD